MDWVQIITKNLVRIAVVSAEVQAEQFPNTNMTSYRLNQLIWMESSDFTSYKKKSKTSVQSYARMSILCDLTISKFSFQVRKPILVLAICHGGPYSRETSRLPHFLDSRLTNGSEAVSLTRQAILVTGLGGPYSRETSRLPHFLDSWLTNGSEVVSLTRQAILVTGLGGPYSRETSRLPHFLDSWLTNGSEVVSLTRQAILVTAVEAHTVVTSRLPRFLHNRLKDGGEAVSLTRRPAALYTKEDSRYSFLLDAESTQGHSAA
jgi:hypothetical protein